MQERFAMFGMNIYLLIGILLALGMLVLLIVATWTGLNILVWRSRRRNAERADWERRFFPDGTPRPPAQRGICGACQMARDVVYHLPDGTQLCRLCLPRWQTQVAEPAVEEKVDA